MDKVYDEFVVFLSTQKKTEIDVEEIAERYDIERYEAIELAKVAAKNLNLRYMVGRRGRPTRIEADSAFNKLLAATPIKKIPENNEVAAALTAQKVQTHSFVLRLDPQYKLEIPVDLTEHEAAKLVAFINAVAN